jgi:hypothetical protein
LRRTIERDKINDKWATKFNIDQKFKKKNRVKKDRGKRNMKKKN